MKNKKYLFTKINLLLLTAAINLSAQTQIKSSVIANGGTTLTGESNRIIGTIGQSISVNMNNQSYKLDSGFWEHVAQFVPAVGVDDDKILLKDFYLSQNYPNPFNPTTQIEYTLPFQAKVSLKVYDALGKEIQTIADGIQSSGFKSVQFNSQDLTSGIYFYRIEAVSMSAGIRVFKEVKKMMILK